MSSSSDRWFDGFTWEPNRRRASGVVLATGTAALVTVPVIAVLVFVGIYSTPAYPGQPVSVWVTALYDHPFWWLTAGPAPFLLSVAYFT